MFGGLFFLAALVLMHDLPAAISCFGHQKGGLSLLWTHIPLWVCVFSWFSCPFVFLLAGKGFSSRDPGQKHLLAALFPVAFPSVWTQHTSCVECASVCSIQGLGVGAFSGCLEDRIPRLHLLPLNVSWSLHSQLHQIFGSISHSLQLYLCAWVWLSCLSILGLLWFLWASYVSFAHVPVFYPIRENIMLYVTCIYSCRGVR